MGSWVTVFPPNLLIPLALKKMQDSVGRYKNFVMSIPNQTAWATNHIHDVLIFYGDLSVQLANAEALHHRRLIW